MDSVTSLVIGVSNRNRQKYLSKSETEKSENIYQIYHFGTICNKSLESLTKGRQ